MALFDPFLVSLFIFSGTNEVLHFHLFKFASPEDEVAGRYFIAKRLSDLRNPERPLSTTGRQHVQEVDENSLRSLRPQINERSGIVLRSRAYVRAKHQVKWTWFSKVLRTALRTTHVLSADGFSDR